MKGQFRPKNDISGVNRGRKKGKCEHLMLAHTESDLDIWEATILKRGLTDEHLARLIRVLRESLEEHNDRLIALERMRGDAEATQYFLKIS